MNDTVTPGGSTGGEIEVNVAERDVVHDRMRPAQHGVNASEQFLQIERLCQVVARPEVETAELVCALTARGQDDDWSRADVLKLLQNGEAILAWQRDVKNDEVRFQFSRGLDHPI